MSGKRSTGGKDGFGAPKPLPGQPGYKMTESAILEKEAKDMEIRLQVLQERLTQQQLEAEKTQKTSANGCRWKSSNPEKGSVRSYGKDVTEKFKAKTLEKDNSRGKLLFDPSAFNDEQPPPLPPKKASPPQTQSNVVSSSRSDHHNISVEKLSNKDPGSWSTTDVGQWLANLQLPQYQDVFGKNEINGEMLIDMTLDDLDYLNITVLGHRKTIMKAVEEIRRQLKSSGISIKQNLAPSGLQRAQSASSSDQQGLDGTDIFVGKSVAVEKPAAQAKPVHWSQLEPISSKQVKGGKQAINSADDDPIDEEAERIAFMKAVEEWRKGDSSSQKKVTIVREFEGKPSTSVSTEVGKSHFSFSEDGDSGGLWKNPFAPAEPSPRGNNTLMEGKLDEAHEHAEFVKAVEAWRTSNKPKVDSNGSDKVKSSAPSIGKMGSSESVLVGDSALLSAKSVAENLAKKMEEEQREVVRKIQKQKEDAERRLLQANQELQQLRLVKEHNVEPIVISARTPRMKESDDRKFTYSKGPQEMNVSFNDSDNDEPVVKKSWASEDDQESWNGTPNVVPSTVKISLVESVIGAVETAYSEDPAMCIVEYDSDDN